MKTSLTALATLALVTPAFAGNLDTPAPTPAPAPVFVEPAPTLDWTGYSVGAQLGYGNFEIGDSSGDDDDDDDDDDELADGDGVIGGLRFGYDYDLGNYVIGANTEYDRVDFDLGNGATIDDIVRIKGRVGYDLGRSLVYGTGGYALATSDELGDADGFVIGAGYERLLTDNISLGTELLYHNFGDFDDSDDIDAEATTANVSLNYRF